MIKLSMVETPMLITNLKKNIRRVHKNIQYLYDITGSEPKATTENELLL